MARRMLWALGITAMIGAAPSCVDGAAHDDLAIQRLETALCDKSAACGCFDDDQSFGLEVTCGDWPPDSPFFRSIDTDRAFDPACVDRWEAWVDTLDCQAAALPHYADLCPLYHGTIPEGMGCSDDNPLSTDCGRGLLCVAGRCRNPEVTAFAGVDEPCDFGDRCEGDQVVCRDEVCRRLPTAGEPCLDRRCDDDSRCEDERCVPLPTVGQSCTSSECAGEAFCDIDPMTGEGECLAKGDLGDPCAGHPQCRSGNCPAGFCEDPARPGEACSNTLPCGEGSLCVNFVCERFPEDAAPVGSICDL